MLSRIARTTVDVILLAQKFAAPRRGGVSTASSVAEVA